MGDQIIPADSRARLRRVEGIYFRSVLADRVEHVLSPPSAESAGRYHRLGQAALYMSPSIEWATIAVSGYIREDGRPRVVVPLTISAAYVLDQYDEDACLLLGIERDHSNVSWRQALAEGKEPPSWRNADTARAVGADGIIDRSRLIPGGWHVNLFCWNEMGGPSVSICGEPRAIELRPDGPKWGL